MLTYEKVAELWCCHRATAIRRLTIAKFPVVRFNDTSVALVRLSDLEKFEQARVETLAFGKFPGRSTRVPFAPSVTLQNSWFFK